MPNITHRGKFKSKPHSDTNLHQLEWPKWTRQEKTNVGEDMEKGHPSYTVGGNAGCYSHFGKQRGGPSKS